MSASTPFTLEIEPGHAVHGLVDLPARPGPRPAVVVCHGFKGFMEWGFFPHLAHLLAERGFTTVRFNFSGGGMKPGDDLVTDPEAFAHATIHRDRRELEAVTAALRGGEIASGRVDPQRLGLLGHSRGGGTALLTAAEMSDLGALVTWSGVASFERLFAGLADGWRHDGRLPIVNARTGQELHLDVSVLDDLESRRDEYDLIAAAGRRRAPWLIVHGDRDETVPVNDARRLAAAAAEPRRLEVVTEGSHTFGAVHPFAGPTPALIRALNATQAWLLRHLA